MVPTTRPTEVRNYLTCVRVDDESIIWLIGARRSLGSAILSHYQGPYATLRASAADYEWNGVAYGNGVFVAVASTGTGRVMRSTDNGVTWTLQTGAVDNAWHGITYANGLFVVVGGGTGSGNRVMTR